VLLCHDSSESAEPITPLLLLLLLVQVLVLDVGSLHLIEAAEPGTEAAAAEAANPEAKAAAAFYVKSVQECSLHCALIPGCNAFSYCSTTTGCGAGCAEWTARHPPGEGECCSPRYLRYDRRLSS
jgi:hypothetical protein